MRRVVVDRRSPAVMTQSASRAIEESGASRLPVVLDPHE